MWNNEQPVRPIIFRQKTIPLFPYLKTLRITVGRSLLSVVFRYLPLSSSFQLCLMQNVILGIFSMTLRWALVTSTRQQVLGYTLRRKLSLCSADNWRQKKYMTLKVIQSAARKDR